METEKPITKKQFLLIKYTLLKQYLLEQPFAVKFSQILPDVENTPFADIVFFISMMFGNAEPKGVIIGICKSHGIVLEDDEVDTISLAVGQFLYFLKSI
jgi:hypothetical protein